ncbi:MAG TPA: hypothetical protein VKR06_29365, partial [Ktedonosporobacter sp.]|nr:hypothetical protein [Ktedonosporobacter sp.]
LEYVKALAYARLDALTAEQEEGKENIDESITETQSQLDRYTEDYRTARDQPAGAVVLTLMNGAAERLAQLKARKAGKLPRQQEIEEEKQNIQAFLTWATEAADKYETADWNWKRMTVHMLGIRVLVYRPGDGNGDLREEVEQEHYKIHFFPFGLRKDLL